MDVFDLFAKISLNAEDFNKGIEDAAKKFNDFSGKVKDISSRLADGFKAVESVGSKAADVVKGGMEALAGAATVAAGSAAMVGKSAFDAYASYEQLVGGVETLFKESSDAVLVNAQAAYQTAGMSANQYMELTTSFAASLLQSLGGNTEKAAEMADMAASDMADNWNKMGSEMRSVTDAYRGFSRQNFTMLDNLKLGYGGTKEEMQRLLAEAEKFSGIEYDISSYADIVSAIHVIQTEMGITGTTAKEASTTIQGSVDSMKAAWENFTVGIATADYIDDYEALTNDLLETVVTAGNNIVPRIQEIAERGLELIPYLVNGLAEVIPEFARMGGEIVQTLADGISAQIPTLLEFGSQAIGAISDGIVKYAPNVGGAVSGLLGDIVDMIGGQSEKLVAAGSAIVETILSGFLNTMDVASKYIGDFVTLIAESFTSYHGALFAVGLDILGSIGEGIVGHVEEIQSIASETIISMVTSLRENAPAMIEGGIALLEALINAIIENLPLIFETGVEIIGSLVESISQALPRLLESGAEIIGNLINGISQNLPQMLEAGLKVLAEFSGSLRENAGKLIDTAIDLMLALAQGLADGLPAIIEYVPEIVSNIANIINDNAPKIITAGVQIIGTLVVGIIQALPTLIENVPKIISAIVDVITAFNWIDLGGKIVKGLINGIKALIGDVWTTIQTIVDNITTILADVPGFLEALGSDIVKGLVSGITAGFTFIKDSIFQLVELLVGTIKNLLGIHSPSTVFAEIGTNLIEGLLGGITEKFDAVVEFFSGAFDGILETFTGLPEKFQSIGGNIVDGIQSGIKNAWSNFISWLTSRVNGIVDAVKNMLGIHSPSKVFAGIGENMALGLAEGWDDEYSSIKRQIENGLDFGTASVGIVANQNSNTSGGAQNGTQAGFVGTGGTTVNIYSPVAVDAVQAAREWKKTTQRMAMGFV